VLLPPLIPDLHALLQDVQVLLVGHEDPPWLARWEDNFAFRPDCLP
jgi:hypothetical protein